MLLQIIAVRDSAVEAFGQPKFTLSIGGANRGFSDEVNRVDENNPMNKHAEDYELYHLGTYDDQNASFDLLPAPRLVARGKDVKK